MVEGAAGMALAAGTSLLCPSFKAFKLSLFSASVVRGDGGAGRVRGAVRGEHRGGGARPGGPTCGEDAAVVWNTQPALSIEPSERRTTSCVQLHEGHVICTH